LRVDGPDTFDSSEMLFALVPVGDLNGRASFPNFSMQGLWTVPGKKDYIFT
jgi:hypothetical protein